MLDGKFETKTDANGQFGLEVPEGDYNTLLVKAPGYVPLWKSLRESVALGRDLVLTLELKPATAPKQGYIILKEGDSYHFLAGKTYSYSGGDFYFSISDKDGAARFLANNWHQQGVVDLGIVNAALCAIEPPSSGYTRFGVQAVVEHTYVSWAKEGEDGHYIVFKVIALTEDSVSLSYCYR